VNRSLAWFVGVALLLAECGGPDAARRTPEDTPMTDTATSPARSAVALAVTSSAFADGAPIPERHSCHGENLSPPLAWRGVPDDAAELALVVDDPDAVGGLYIHWVIAGISKAASGVGAGHTPTGGTVLPNSGGEASYLGPCQPAGTGVHHYRFTLYVLPEPLRLDPDTDAPRAVEAIGKLAVAQGRLVGTYRG
jgi:Raf kinase inhibitor-like YbhB/YbcL family protein